MASSLDRAFDAHHNSLDFVRFVLTTSVVLIHCHAAAGVACPWLKFSSGDGYAEMIVPGFFSVSGFLIARSFLTAPSVWHYLSARTLRIFPAYWVCLLLTAGVIAPLAYVIDHGGLTGFTIATGPSAVKYALVNSYLKQRQGEIAGIWQNLPFPHAVNGPLWTLYFELKFYLLIAVLGSLGMLGHGAISSLSASSGSSACWYSIGSFPQATPCPC